MQICPKVELSGLPSTGQQNPSCFSIIFKFNNKRGLKKLTVIFKKKKL